ncbi:hypothetical protein ACVW0A_004534 [Pseudomonas sp. TE3610]
MPSHKGRVMVVRLNCTDVSGVRHVVMSSKKYEYAFPNDSLSLGIKAAARVQYCSEMGILDNANYVITLSTSIRNSR